jgi:ribosomal-protein-serine acetyltransferase
MKAEDIIFDEIIRAEHGIELRAFKLEDALFLFALVEENRNYLKRWLPWVDSTKTVEDEIGFIEFAIRARVAKKALGYGIYSESKIVGVVGYHELIWANAKGKIGYWLTESTQGKGVMTLACRALMDYGFKKLGLNRIEILAASENQKSRAIPRRLGLKHEGTLRQDEKVGDIFFDSEVYGILKSEWLSASHGDFLQ